MCLTSLQEARWRDYQLIFSDGTKNFVAVERWRERQNGGASPIDFPKPSLPYAQYMLCLRDAVGRYERELASAVGSGGAK